MYLRQLRGGWALCQQLGLRSRLWGIRMAGTSEGEWCSVSAVVAEISTVTQRVYGKMSPHPEIISSKEGNLAGGGGTMTVGALRDAPVEIGGNLDQTSCILHHHRLTWSCILISCRRMGCNLTVALGN